MAQAAKVINLKTKRRSTLSRKEEERQSKLERIIFVGIGREFRDVDYFTREDLLQLRALQNVATITRYRMVCEAVTRLLSKGMLFQRSRTELCVLRNRSVASKLPPVQDQYEPQVSRLVTQWAKDYGAASFDVMTLVERWTMDQNITPNAKRVAVRINLQRLCKKGNLIAGPSMDYIVKSET